MQFILSRRFHAALLLSLALFAVQQSLAGESLPKPPADGVLRVATYNISMYRDRVGQLLDEFKTGESEQAKKIAEVLQRVRPNMVLLNEFDYMPGKPQLVTAFRELYLEQSHAGIEPIRYPHFFYEPVNTGVDSGMDLNQDGKLGGPDDAWGFGHYPGQYGMLVLSQLPLGTSWRTYREMKWRHLASARWPRDPATGDHYYSKQQRELLRLASKSFWDVELQLPTTAPGRRWRPLRLLCSHPTPPVFDGPEDRNGCRNFDEIRMITEYISGSQKSEFPVDANEYLSEGEGYDTLPEGAEFVVLGDLNADPVDGDSRPGAIQQLLTHPAIDASFVPTSPGALQHAQRPDAKRRRGDPEHHTSEFGLRIDYVLPSKGLIVLGGGVFWPKKGLPGAEAIKASDHRLVWLDIELPH